MERVNNVVRADSVSDDAKGRTKRCSNEGKENGIHLAEKHVFIDTAASNKMRMNMQGEWFKARRLALAEGCRKGQ